MARKGNWYVVETEIDSKFHYSRPLAYQTAVKVMGEMARSKFESRLWTIHLTANQFCEIERMADAGVPCDYSKYGGLQ